MSQEKKKHIFETAVKLFAERSYDVVSIRDLSSAAGVKDATLYHYFKSKEGILKEIITEFKYRLKSYLITKEQTDALIETDAPDQVLRKFIPHFKDEDALFMFRAYRIVCMEQFTYQEARDVVVKQFYNVMSPGFKYALDKLIERGKIPALDTELFSVLWADSMFSRMMMCINGSSDENMECLNSGDFAVLGNFMIDMAVKGTAVKQ